MKKYEILYDWPNSEIQRLADSEIAEDYAEGLGEVSLASFTTLTEQMRGLGADLAHAKATRTHLGKWDELRQCLEAFEQQFADFPNMSMPKFRLSVLLADKLSQMAPALDAEDIDQEAFEIRHPIQTLPLSWFSRENAQSPADSMAVFSCANLAALEADIAGWNVSPKFAFHFLAALHALPNAPVGHAVLVKKEVPEIDIAAIDAFVRLVVLATGKSVHTARRYLNAPSVLNADVMCSGHVYQQWSDVLAVLSEYNSRDDVLLKYLTIYHVIENFMFKLPIVRLERQQSGRMFSIRDFRRLYYQVDMNEPDALKQLFSAVLILPAIGGMTFQQHLIARWIALVPVVTEADIDSTLAALGLPFAYSGFTGAATAGYFAKLVYSIRNAIVHNKETEFHLTYASLDATVCAVMEAFLIPSLEEISFSLIGCPNPQLWYGNREILLYK